MACAPSRISRIVRFIRGAAAHPETDVKILNLASGTQVLDFFAVRPCADAPSPEYAEATPGGPFPIEDEHKAAQSGIGVECRRFRPSRDNVPHLVNEVLEQSLGEAIIERPRDHKEEATQSIVDPAVGPAPQVQAFVRLHAPKQSGVLPVIDPNMSIAKQGTGLFARSFMQFLARSRIQAAGPPALARRETFRRSADFWHRVQVDDFGELCVGFAVDVGAA